jgi:hypothetical protein
MVQGTLRWTSPTREFDLLTPGSRDIEAEGLSSSSLPAYNALLHVWGAASALTIIREVRPGARRWALVGLATVPLLRRSAQHHFSWLKQEALTNPAWWNRGAI